MAVPLVQPESKEEVAAPPTPARAWVRPVLAILLAGLVLYAALFFYHAIHQSFAPAEIHYAEGTWFFAALRVRHGLSPYFDYSHAPYIAMIYPPLDPGISGILGNVLGITDEGIPFLTRLVTLASTLAAAAAVFGICRRLRCGWLPSGIVALLLLTPPDTYRLWGFVARSDMMAVALGLWSIFFLLGAANDDRSPTWQLALGGALVGLGLAAKQTELAPVVAALWWLWPRWRRGLVYIAGLAVGLVVPLAPLGVEGVRLLLKGMSDLSAQPILDDALYGRLRDLLSLFGSVMPISLLGMVRSATPASARGLLVRYAGVAALVFLLTAGKVGTASQYTLELIAVLAVLAGPGIQWLIELTAVSREVVLAALVLVLAPLGVQTVTALNTAQDWRSPGADERPLMALDAVRKGPVLSEDGYIVLHGADPPVMLDPYYFSVLETLGRWDPAPLTRRVANKEFSAVVISRPVETPFVYQGVRWIPPEVLGAVAKNYTLSTTIGRYYVYTPRK